MEQMREYHPIEQDFGNCLVKTAVVIIGGVVLTIFILGILIGMAIIGGL
jgi:hypothetical protein